MPSLKISQLDNGGAIQGTDQIPVYRSADPAKTYRVNVSGFIGGLVFQGEIAASADFPTIATVQNGWFFKITADVTDNDPTKTNTGQSFKVGDFPTWNGTNWTDISGLEVFIDDGTDVKTINDPRNIDIQTAGLKDNDVTTPVALGDSSNTSFSTTNKTIIGSLNELNTNKLDKSLSDGNIFVGNSSNIATSVVMSSEASIVNTGAITLDNNAVTGKVLTGFTSGAGTISASDSILSAFQKVDGNIAWLKSGDDIYLKSLNDNVALGVTDAGINKLRLEKTNINSGGRGCLIFMKKFSTANGAYDTTGAYFTGQIKIDAGITDSGSYYGYRNDALRDQLNDAGTLGALTGYEINVGHLTNCTGITNSLFAQRVRPFAQNGTIVNFTAFKMESLNGSPSNISGNFYGVEIRDTSAKNYFAGNVGFGTETPGKKIEISSSTGDNLRLRNDSEISDIGIDDNGNITISLSGDSILFQGKLGRDSDNYVSWVIDDQLDIRINGVTTSVQSISTGAANNDKLVTQGYVDDSVGTKQDTLTNGADDLTTAEVNQLKNIDSVTINNTQWGYVGAMDQGLATTDSLKVVGLEIDGDLDHDGSNIGFYGTVPIAKPSITGSRGGNAALQSLLTQLGALGLITDNTTA